MQLKRSCGNMLRGIAKFFLPVEMFSCINFFDSLRWKAAVESCSVE